MKLVRLSEVSKIVNGGTPKSGVSEYWGGDVAWLTPAEMGKRVSPYIAETARTISRTGLANCSARQVPVDAVIMSTRAPIGHLAIPEVPMAFNQGCRGLIPSDALDTKYLYYFLWFSREALNELGTGTTFKELSSGALGNYLIPLPPIEEQRRVVAVLDVAVAAIATATANADRNLANADALIEQHLQTTFNSAPGAAIRKLGEISSLITDGTHNSPPYVDVGVPMLDTKNIDDDFLIDDSIATKFISRETDTLLSRRCKPQRDDVLISSRGTIGRIAIVNEGQDFNIMGNMILVRTPSDMRPKYLANFMRSEISKLEAISRGTAQKGLYLNQIRDYEIPVPHLDEQDRMIEALSEMRAATNLLGRVHRQKLVALGNLKQSLLHMAFSGELAEAEAMAA